MAVSGGADSVALLRLLAELRKEFGIVLSVVHLNHQLRGAESEGDERFVSDLAAQLKLPFHVSRTNAADYAKEKRISLEAAGRQLRYDFFFELVHGGKVNRIATAHTLDDQAETVLLKLVRGAGSRGLAGIYPSLPVPGVSDGAAIVRPLLGIRRLELEEYLKSIGQDWREDSSNRDLRHARNRVRHGILPRLERYLNPSVRTVLAETADIARAEEDYWQREVDGFMASSEEALSVDTLSALPVALARRVIRSQAQAQGLHLEFHHVESIRAVLAGEVKGAELPDGWSVARRGHLLCFEKNKTASPDYAYELPIPGKIELSESGVTLEALLVTGAAAAAYNPEQLLDRSRLDLRLQVRNWRAGDRFWPAHTKAPRKVKELLQDRKIAGREREAWPVIVSGGEVIWVLEFPAPENLRARPGEPAIVIRETRRAPHHD